jgi:RNA-directed DNA polymerase
MNTVSLAFAKSKDDLRREFFQLGTKHDVASLLEVEYSHLAYHLYVKPFSERYTTFFIPKKSGSVREISSPNTGLKIIQQKLNYILQQVYQPKPSVHGFTYGKSIVSNARSHCKQRYVLNIDLKDFFPSINFGRVRGMFMNIPYQLPTEAATVLAQICCWNDSLPQGAPTSPVISNMLCSKLDSQLQRLAREHRCFYTRYADDLTFSTNARNFPNALATTESSPTGDELQVGRELYQIIRGNGFEINDSKVRLLQNSRRQEVTGLTTNVFPNVTRKYVRQVRAMLHAWEKYGLEAADEEFRSRWDKRHRHPDKDPVSFKQVVKGKIEFFGHVRGREHPIYLDFCNRLRELAPELVKNVPATPPVGQSITMVSIRTEGKTDLKHLRAAYRSLTAAGEIRGLSVQFNEGDLDTGSSDLLDFCKQASKLEYHPNPLICIFDNDEPSVLRQIKDKDVPYKDWGNNVFSLALPVPDHREDNPEVCIELYYKDSELMRVDSAGRRLFLSNEFNRLSGKHKTETELNCTVLNKVRANKLSIIDASVFNLNEENVALSKDAFAENVLNEVENFDDFDFSEFRKVFEMIAIIAESVRPSPDGGQSQFD